MLHTGDQRPAGPTSGTPSGKMYSPRHSPNSQAKSVTCGAASFVCSAVTAGCPTTIDAANNSAVLKMVLAPCARSEKRTERLRSLWGRTKRESIRGMRASRIFHGRASRWRPEQR